MPRGPKGEKRPGDVIGAAIMVGRLATGEIEERTSNSSARQKGARGGKVGGKARAKVLSAERRKEIAKKAALKRWRSGRSSSG
jgi:hypothetical protein